MTSMPRSIRITFEDKGSSDKTQIYASPEGDLDKRKHLANIHWTESLGVLSIIGHTVARTIKPDDDAITLSEVLMPFAEQAFA